MITAQQLAAALRAAANSLDGGNANEAQTQYVQQQPIVQQQQPIVQQQPVVQQQPMTQPGVPQNITAEQLIGLIQPHIGNDAIKAALGNAMRAQGVANLPDAQPHQYGSLWASFQQVLAQFGIGAGGAPQQQPQTASII